MPTRQNPILTQHARDLRARQTKAEALLWSVLRNRSLCNLKFRRQHPIKPFIADSACIQENLIVEVDGGYHDDDLVHEDDMSRQEKLESLGWQVLRFSNEEVLEDVNAVGIGIARRLGRTPEFVHGKNRRKEPK